MIHRLQKHTWPTTNKYCVGGSRIVVINRVYIVLLLSQPLKVCTQVHVIVIVIMVVYRPIAMCAVVVI